MKLNRWEIELVSNDVLGRISSIIDECAREKYTLSLCKNLFPKSDYIKFSKLREIETIKISCSLDVKFKDGHQSLILSTNLMWMGWNPSYEQVLEDMRRRLISWFKNKYRNGWAISKHITRMNIKWIPRWTDVFEEVYNHFENIIHQQIKENSQKDLQLV